MTPTPLVELRNVRKAFGSVVALDQVNFSVSPGEIRGLLGENGAGKSSLMKVLYGLYAPDEGEIFIDGQRADITSPFDSITKGIGMVHQSSTLVPEFTALENIMMCTEGSPWNLPRAAVSKRIGELSEEFGLSFPVDTKTVHLSAGVKQKIEIIRALYRGVKLLILDEPTTSLVESEFRQLLKSLQALVAQGVTVIFITHKMREVMESCHSVTVMRKGKIQSSLSKEEMSKEQLVKLMFMEQDIEVTESALPKVAIEPRKRGDKPVLSLQSVSTQAGESGIGLDNVTLEVYGGEILGVAAVSGNGEKELAEVVVHPRMVTGGTMSVGGESILGLDTLEVFAKGVAYTPEDRIHEGILNEASIIENVLLGHHAEERFLNRKMFVDWPEARKAAKEVVDHFNVDTPDEDFAIRRLSGGNIQKTIMGRAFVSDPRLLVTHNPTSGLDISTVEFIFEKLVQTRNEGEAILWISEDLDELMILSDRIAVLYQGRIVAVFDRVDFDKFTIGLQMIGGE